MGPDELILLAAIAGGLWLLLDPDSRNQLGRTEGSSPSEPSPPSS